MSRHYSLQEVSTTTSHWFQPAPAPKILHIGQLTIKNCKEQKWWQEAQSESEYAQELSSTEEHEYTQESSPKKKGPKCKKNTKSQGI